jgi:hypothetical protein
MFYDFLLDPMYSLPALFSALIICLLYSFFIEYDIFSQDLLPRAATAEVAVPRCAGNRSHSHGYSTRPEGN